MQFLMAHFPNTAAFPLLQDTVSFSRSELRWDFLNIAGAITLLTVALAAIALFFFRRRTRDLTLIYIGVFCVLYAVRLLSHLDLFRALFHHSTDFWDSVDWMITCSIVLPFGLFLYQLANQRLRKLLRWLLAAQALFAVWGILAVVFHSRLTTLFFLNNILVLGTFAAVIVFAVASQLGAGPQNVLSHEFRVFLGGFLVWGLFVLHANLLGLRVLTGKNVEVLGFLVFVICLGYVSAYRIFGNEERLLAINKELEIARRIQFSTLPQSVPALAGLDIAARYVPMSAVAGDFYDFLNVDEKRVGVLVADVTGHGVPAALIASMLKVALAGQAEHASDPDAVLTGLNFALCGKFEEHFVTAAYLFVDLENQMVRYSAAGHPPMMLVAHGSQKTREIEENGLMLGLFPEAEYSSQQISTSPGDRFLLYTDGVFEAQNAAHEEFGKARCREFLEAHRSLSAAELASALLHRVDEFAGHKSARAQEDDITVVVLDF